jgi:GH43 family beta-xylosidase
MVRLIDPRPSVPRPVFRLRRDAKKKPSYKLLQEHTSAKTASYRTPAPNTDHSAHLWAPELHALHGRWYIYVAAANPQHGNRSHRMFVLGGPPELEDPHAGPWEFLGPIRNMDQRQWAIDGTPFDIDGTLYFAYSGWPLDRAWDDYDERCQQLFVMRLLDPVTASSTAPVMISTPDQSWEFSGEAGINEGPQWLSSPASNSDGESPWRGLVYSCAGSWTSDYKMATLTFLGGDPLLPGSWEKAKRPLLQNAAHGKGPFGPGHGNFVRVGEETVAVFHATDGAGDGHGGRKARMQRVWFGREGPFMGGEVGECGRDVARFAGGSVGVGGGGGCDGKGSRLRDLWCSIVRKRLN